MIRIFISHSHSDKAFSTRLAAALRERGFEPWIDHEGIRGGARWSTSIQEGLDACQALVLVLSPTAMGSSNVEDEWQYALDEGTPIVPVLVEPTRVHFQLKRIQHIDFLERDFGEAVVALERSLRDALAEAAPDADASAAASTDGLDASSPVVCPYRGLRAFREEDAPYFFGREAFTTLLVDAMGASPMVGVIGPSGSGKSSVVHAGLVPALRSSGDEGGAWAVVDMRPGSEPYRSLARALLPLLEGEDLSETDRLVEVNKMAGHMRDGQLHPKDVLSRARETRPALGRLLLVADQFEELYTLTVEEEVQRAFQDLLFEAAFESNGGLPLTLALTLRADFLGHALAYRPFADAIQKHDVKLGPMNREELARAIARPAERQGRAFESGLVERIIDDVGEKAGRLPLLEFALTKLWERQVAGRLTHEAYEAIGRVEGAVARHADAVYAELGEHEQERTRRVFVQLVQPGEGTEDTRRLATHDELAEDWGLVRRLADQRLVTTGRDADGRQTVEVVHEALIRSWGRLVEWMKADRRFRTWQERLRFAIRQWHEAGEDESALLRGVPLAEAEQWADERGAELTGEEADFVAASQARARAREAERERQRRRTRRLQGAVAVVSVLGLLVASALALSERQSRRRSDALALVAKSQELLAEDQGDQALAVALEALVVDPGLGEAELALSEAAYSPGSTRELALGVAATRMILHPVRDRLIVGTHDGPVLVVDIDSWSVEREIVGHEGAVYALAIHPDGSQLITGGRDGRVISWDFGTGERRWTQTMGGVEAWDAAFPSDGQHVLVSGSQDLGGRLWLMDSSDGQIAREFEHKDAVHAVALSMDGRIAVGAEGNPNGDGVIAWDVAAGSVIARMSDTPVTAVALTVDGQQVIGAIKGYDSGFGQVNQREIVVWDLFTGREQRRFTGHPATVRSVEALADGRRLLSTSYDQTIRVWDLDTGENLTSLGGHEDGVRSALVDEEAQVVYSVSDGGVLRAWRLNSPALAWSSAPSQDEQLTAVALSPEGASVLATDVNGDAWLLDSESGGDARRIRTAEGRACSAAFAPDSPRVAIGTENGVELWELDPPVRRWRARPPRFSSSTGCSGVAFTNDGNHVLSTGYSDWQLHTWRTSTGDAVAAIGLRGTTTRIRTDASARWLVSPMESGDQQPSAWTGLWDLESGKRVRLFEGHEGSVLEATISPNGAWVATAGSDSTAILWERATGAAHQRIALDSTAWSLAFNPDGNLLALGMDTGEVLMWDIERQMMLRRYPSVGGASAGVAFTKDGTGLVSIVDDRVHRWIVHPSAERLKTWLSEARFIKPISCRDRTALALPKRCPDDQEGLDLLPGSDRQALLAPRPGQGHGDAGERRITSADNEFDTPPYWFESEGEATVGPEIVDLATAARRLDGLGDSINDLTFSQDGRYLVSAYGRWSSVATVDAGVRIWDVADGAEVRHWPSKSNMVSAQISGDHARMVGLSATGALLVWDTGSQRLVRRIKAGGYGQVRLLPDGQHVVLARRGSHSVHKVDLSTGEAVAKFAGRGWVGSVVPSPDGAFLVTGASDGRVVLWDIEEQAEVAEYRFPEAPPGPKVRAVALTPGGDGIFAAGSAPPTLWDRASGEVMRQFVGHVGVVQSLAVSPGGRYLLSAGDDRTVRLWDIATGTELQRYLGHRLPIIRGLAFSPDGMYAASAGLARFRSETGPVDTFG